MQSMIVEGMNTRENLLFIGHRDVSKSIYDRLLTAVERHISEYGVIDFVVGRYGNFDRLAMRAVI